MKRLIIAIVAVSAGFASCKKNADVIDEYATTDTTGYLKKLAPFPMGIGVRLEHYKGNAYYPALIDSNFNSITFTNELKHEYIVNSEGKYDYTNTDEFVNLAQARSLDIHGHALVGHNINNITYLRSLNAPATVQNAVANGNFESGSGSSFSNWVTQVDATAAGNFQAETSGVYEGSRAMKVVVTNPGQNQYSIQAYSDNFSLSAGYSYTLTFYARAATHGSRFKAVIQNATYQERTFFLTQSWEKYTWTFTADENSETVRLHFPYSGSFYFDNLSIMRPVSGNFVMDAVKLDNSMKDFITGVVTRYKNKVKAWDVVNEPFEDATGNLRDNPQPGTVSGGNFYWKEYLGKEYISKAFKYAKAADPNALLFINEDKLESDDAKVNALVNLVNELKNQNVPIDGIGIQMHLTIKNDRAAIESARSKIASTGLKIKISEMDVRINPWNQTGFSPSDDLLNQQRDLYRFVVGAYFRLVPAAQRYGITLWNLTDKDSWIVTGQGKEDFPTLFSGNYTKKPAYYGVVVGLRNK